MFRNTDRPQQIIGSPPHTQSARFCGHLILPYGMSLLTLPNELLLHIVGYFRTQGPLYALLRSCRFLHHLLRKYLLQHNVRYSKGSALIWAAKRDRRNLVRRLLRLGAVVNTRGEPLRAGTPLHSAAAEGHLGMSELLIKKGGDPEICGIRGYKPLLVALFAGHEEVAIFLFGKMSSPTCEIGRTAGYTPLHAACQRNLPRSAGVFLKSGADVNGRTSSGVTPLHFALTCIASGKSDDSTQNCTLELVVLLLDHGASKDTRAYHLGTQHPYLRVRKIFQEDRSCSRQRSPFATIGRRWWAEDSSEYASTSTPTGMNQSENRGSAEASKKEEYLPDIGGNLLDDKLFPALDPSWSIQPQQSSISAWDTPKVEDFKRRMLVNESTQAAKASSSILRIETFPKLIGRKYPRSFEGVAQLSWKGLVAAQNEGMTEESRTNSQDKTQESGLQDKIQGPGLQVGQARRKKKWRPLQLN